MQLPVRSDNPWKVSPWCWLCILQGCPLPGHIMRFADFTNWLQAQCLCLVFEGPPYRLDAGFVTHPWTNLYWCCHGALVCFLCIQYEGPLWTCAPFAPKVPVLWITCAKRCIRDISCGVRKDHTCPQARLGAQRER